MWFRFWLRMVKLGQGLWLLLALMGGAHAAQEQYRVAMEADDVVTRTLFDAVSQHFSIKVEYVLYPSFSDILQSVESGESDFAANVTYTPERAQYFDFSAPTNIEYTYLFSPQARRLGDVQVVGVPNGTIYGELIERHFPAITLIEYSGHHEAVRLLNAGEVDGVVDAINQLKPMLLSGFDAELLNDQIPIKPVSIVTTKGQHSDLLAAIEHYVHSASVQKLLRESIRQYQFNIRRDALRNVAKESGLELDRPLRVKLENFGQYATYHADGSVSGIAADVLFQACDILLLKCQLESQANETWESMYQDLVNQAIDVLAPVAVLESRRGELLFGDSYYFPEAILVKREGYKKGVYSNISELIAERIGVIKEAASESLLNVLLPNKRFKVYNNSQALVTALLNGEIDYIPMTRGSFHALLRESKEVLPLEEDTAIAPFYRSEVAMGFANNQLGAQLVPLFNQALTMIDVEKIIHLYDNQPDWKATLHNEKSLAQQNQALLLFVLAFLVIVAYFLYSQSNTDNLTRLRNRRAMQRKYRLGLKSRDTLVYFDVNGFKAINDTYGHEIGDEVLKAIANQIVRYWQGSAYRIGGDEFILIGPMDEGQLDILAQHVAALTYTSWDNSVSLNITLAMGVCQASARSLTLQQALNQADQAMYSHKRKQRERSSQSAKEQGSLVNCSVNG
ncbi:GGDEF domain-containing protein [Vibrio scophthalmi]|uniref:GGDEF domain-containing protein n=1 Tax=Vibrio scophthalmi TaxID=45658 RepID=UPI002FF0CCCB